MNCLPSRASVALVLTLLAGCGGDRPDAGGTTIVDSAGVALAVAAAVDQPLGWTLTERFRLGGADDGPGSFTSASMWNTGTDREGRIYVLDGQQFRVEVFAPSGEHLRFLGRKGGGPGEIEFPISLFVSPAGVAQVFDAGKLALVRWDANGELLPPISLQGSAPRFPIAYGDTLILGLNEGADTLRTTRLVTIVGGDTTTITSFTTPTGAMAEFSCVSFVQPPVFSPTLQWTTNGRAVATTRQASYQVDVYDGATLVRSIRRSIPSRPTSVDDVKRLYPNGMEIQFGGGRGCTIPATEIMEKQGVAPTVPQIRSLRFDPQDRLWVERYTFADEPALVDLFDASGHYLGSLSGTGPPLGFIGTDVILFAQEDEETGVRQVVAYQVTGG